MPQVFQHHCSICGKVGNQRCLNAGHYLQCPIHPTTYHSKHALCVKCVYAHERQAKQDARDRSAENESEDTSELSIHVKRPKKSKSAKCPTSQNLKQIRRSKKTQKKSDN